MNYGCMSHVALLRPRRFRLCGTFRVGKCLVENKYVQMARCYRLFDGASIRACLAEHSNRLRSRCNIRLVYYKRRDR